LFYIGLDSRLMAVPIRLDSTAMVVEAGSPVFLMNTVLEQAASPLTVILNWKPKP